MNVQRIIALVVSAVGGSSAGYLVHQVLSRKDGPEANNQLVIGAPLTVLIGAALLGFAAGRRGAIVAFSSGLVAAILLGTRADDAIPGVSDARRRAVAKLGDDPAAD